MHAPAASLSWFNEARFGIFIHWGLYSVHGRDVWAMYHEQTPDDEYRALADEFVPRHFDPDEWAAMAKAAGARYMVFCTRQHDGFSLFDSAVSDFTSVKSPAGRDFVAEYADAARRAGLGVGFYYSLLDWRYPAYFHGPEKDPEGWSALVDYVHAQLEELCTNYGKVDVLWYDGVWPYGAEEWRSEEINAKIRSLQPEVLINDRSGLPEDYDTPEQLFPDPPPARAWETCMTMNDQWGYGPTDLAWKPTGELIAGLVRCASSRGNYLLNVGPDPDGAFPPEAVVRLREIGAWLRGNGEAIYDTDDSRGVRDRIESTVYTSCDLLPVGMVDTWPTVRGNTLYTHVRRWPGKELVIGNLPSRVIGARFLDGGEPIEFEQQGSRVIMSDLPQYAPDPFDTVIALECEGPPATAPRFG